MNNNNKPVDAWTEQLFKSAGSKPTNARRKTYFGHCYQGHGQLVADNGAFSGLFAPAGIADANNLLAGGINPHPVNLAPKAHHQSQGGQFLVLNCYDESPDTKTFRLAKPNGATVDYLPGQYVTLSIVIDGKEYKRSYSLASTPSHQGIIEITVKRDANGGVVSNWLNDNLKIGARLDLKGPFGKFSCALDTPAKILFMAAGSGIVPIMSMLRWLADTEKQADAVLLLSFRSFHDIIYRRELELIASRQSKVRLHVTLTKERHASGRWGKLKGRINKDMLSALVPDLPERAVYLCGPDEFMAESRQYLLDLNHPEERLFYESFSIDNPGSAIQPVGPNLPPALSPLSGAIRNYQVIFARSGINIATDGGINLLVLAENSGIKIDHECRKGSCGECMVKCLEGKVDLTKQAEIDEIDRKKGWVYACCAYPSSNVTLDI